jgi:hypothetical protein
VAAARFEIYMVRRRADGAEIGADGATWRLLSNNNRDLGHAVDVFQDIDLCGAAVEFLRQHAEHAVSASLRTGRADWTWRVQIGQAAVAVSSRRYQRRVQAEYACGVFLGLVAGAALMNTVRLVQR